MRSLVHDCLAKHLYESAIFYADKLVTMSKEADTDVYTLAEVTRLHLSEMLVKTTFIMLYGISSARAFSKQHSCKKPLYRGS